MAGGGGRAAEARAEGGEGQPRAAIAVVIAGLETASRVYPTCGALYCATRASPSCVAIHPIRKKILTKKMDPRVEPAGDGRAAWARGAPPPAPPPPPPPPPPLPAGG